MKPLFYAFLALVPFTCFANGFGIFSRHDELKGHEVVQAGDIEKIEVRRGTLGSTTDLLKLGLECYQPILGLPLWGYGRKAGFVLVDRARSTRIAIVEAGIGSIEVQSIPVTRTSCTSTTKSVNIDDMVDQMRKEQEADARRLEVLRQQIRESQQRQQRQ